jgi:hypothetical protein
MSYNSIFLQLASLADALSLKVCYRHINKKDKKDNFVSLVKLTTNPPKVRSQPGVDSIKQFTPYA